MKGEKAVTSRKKEKEKADIKAYSNDVFKDNSMY